MAQSNGGSMYVPNCSFLRLEDEYETEVLYATQSRGLSFTSSQGVVAWGF